MQCLRWSVWTPNFLPIPKPHLLNYSMICVCGQVASWCPWVQGFLFLRVWRYCD